MKRRINIFETNSSSSHSISFNPWQPGKDGNNFVPEQDGYIYVTGGEFGWDWGSYNDAVTKANYYFEQYIDDSNRLNILKEVIEEYTGYPVTFRHQSDGYIDHQSCGILQLPPSHVAVRDWIFNPDNWLYTGNDNDEEPSYLRDLEWKSIGGDHVTVTLDFGKNDVVEIKIIGMPGEENLGPKLNGLSLSDGDYYDLKEMDLEKNHIVLYETWSNRERTGKIIKIKSDEFGEIVP